MSRFSKLVFVWGGCHHVLQQLGIPEETVGAHLSPVGQWPSSRSLQGGGGVFSSPWAQCDISSVWHTMPVLCFSHVSCGLFNTTTIGLY